MEINRDAFVGMVDKRDEQIKQLQAQLELCREALDEIANPISYMRKEAEEQGCQLDGGIAIMLGENASYLKGIAIKALSSIPTECCGCERCNFAIKSTEYHNPADVEALKLAGEALDCASFWLRKHGYTASLEQVQEALAAIEKAGGQNENT